MSHRAQFRVVTSPDASDDDESDDDASEVSVVSAAAPASDEADVSDVPPHPAREAASMPAVNTAANTLFFILSLLLMKFQPSAAIPHASWFPFGTLRCGRTDTDDGSNVGFSISTPASRRNEGFFQNPVISPASHAKICVFFRRTCNFLRFSLSDRCGVHNFVCVFTAICDRLYTERNKEYTDWTAAAAAIPGSGCFQTRNPIRRPIPPRNERRISCLLP